MTRSRVKKDFAVGIDDNASGERLEVNSGNVIIKANSGSTSHAFGYNEDGGEITLYDEAGSVATLIDQAVNNTRVLELIDGSDILLGLGGSNSTGTVKFMGAGYAEAMRIESTGNLNFVSSTTNPINLLNAGKTGTYNRTAIYNGYNDTSNNIYNGLLVELGRLTDVSTAEIRKFHIAGRGGGSIASFDADGLKFGADTAAANALDDYEEGTWTPTITTFSGTATVADARYTRIGQHVTAHAHFQWSNNQNNNSNQFFFGGLPYTSAASSHYYAGSIAYTQGRDITDWYLIGLTNDTRFYFTKKTTAGNVTNAEVTAKGLTYMICSLSYITDA